MAHSFPPLMCTMPQDLIYFIGNSFTRRLMEHDMEGQLHENNALDPHRHLCNYVTALPDCDFAKVTNIKEKDMSALKDRMGIYVMWYG